MRKILISLILSIFVCGSGFSMISPKNMLNIINQSQIKTPAVIKSVKTVQNRQGNRIQTVEFEGLYNNSGQKYEAKCHNFKSISPWNAPMVGGFKSYYPKKGQRVFVTIDYPKGEITSMVIMDDEFEKNLQTKPQALKYDCNGAYFED